MAVETLFRRITDYANRADLVASPSRTRLVSIRRVKLWPCTSNSDGALGGTSPWELQPIISPASPCS
jgi:hypothetical protein